jgi:hypothetical protein
MTSYIFVKDITADDTYHMVHYDGAKIKRKYCCLYGSKITREHPNLIYDTLESVLLSLDKEFNAIALFDKYLNMKNLYTYELISKLSTIRDALHIRKGLYKFPYLIEYYLYDWYDDSIKNRIEIVKKYALSQNDRAYFNSIIVDDIKSFITEKEDKMQKCVDTIMEYSEIADKLNEQQ